MKVTSAQANKLFRKLNEEYASLLLNERDSSTFLASVGEDAESVRPDYDYKAVRDRLNEIEEQLRKLKHALNLFNSSTRIEEFDMTIDEMLVYIPQLTKRKAKLQTMKNRLPKARCSTNFNKNIIDYEYINYSLDEVREDFEKVSDELARAQIALDTANNSIEFELDI